MPRQRTLACTNCGHLVRKRDVVCEHCGAETPQASRKSAIRVVGFLIVALIVVWGYFQLTGINQHLLHR